MQRKVMQWKEVMLTLHEGIGTKGCYPDAEGNEKLVELLPCEAEPNHSELHYLYYKVVD